VWKRPHQRANTGGQVEQLRVGQQFSVGGRNIFPPPELIIAHELLSVALCCPLLWKVRLVGVPKCSLERSIGLCAPASKCGLISCDVHERERLCVGQLAASSLCFLLLCFPFLFLFLFSLSLSAPLSPLLCVSPRETRPL